MVFGARITLTSPDPSAPITNPHNEHEHEHNHKHTAFSESHTVTFNAYKSSTSPSSLTESESDHEFKSDKSSTPDDFSSELKKQRVKATIDSVPLYDNNDSNDDDTQQSDQIVQQTNEDAINEQPEIIESIKLDSSKNDIAKDEL